MVFQKRTLNDIFQRIRKQSGIKRNDHANYQPRMHDLRHTFAVNILKTWYRQKKDVQALLPILSTYLEKSEMEALLNAPDKLTEQGQRDYAILLFLYNTGARADEVAQLTIGNLDIALAKKRDLSTVLIRGKGNKFRRCPL